MIPDGLKKWLAFGSGLGIAIEGPRGAETLRVTALRVRPNGIRIAGGFGIENFEQQPAAEWGAAVSAFATKLGMRHVPAMVALPRQDVILRVVSLPGVAGKDLAGAIDYQMDGMHPWDEAAVLSSFARLGASDAVMVAVARADVVSRYATLFAEAGIRLAGFTCSAPAVYSALRVFGRRANADLLAYSEMPAAVEIYAESAAKPVLSASFPTSLERAVALASAEMRFENPPAPVPLAELLRAETPLSYAAAISSACPQLTLNLNLLPAEQRQIASPLRWVGPGALALVVILLSVGLSMFPNWENGRYLQKLEGEISQTQPRAERVGAIEKRVTDAQQRIVLLDQQRATTKGDMDVLAELTRRLSPPTWVTSLEIGPEFVTVAGETPEAAPLLKLLDESALFEASEFIGAPLRRDNGEGFRIRARRSARSPVTLSAAATGGDQ